MKIFTLLLSVFVFQIAGAQKLSKADKKMLESYKNAVRFLSDDKLEGRRTGSHGEKLAYEFITSRFNAAGLVPYAGNDFLQAFTVAEGKEILPATQFLVNENRLELMQDFFPLAFSANKPLQTTASLSLNETGAAWFFDCKELLESNKGNPHFDLKEALMLTVKEVARKNASALLVYNSCDIKDNLAFEVKDKTASVSIPVIYLSNKAMRQYFTDGTSTYGINLNVSTSEKSRLNEL